MCKHGPYKALLTQANLDTGATKEYIHSLFLAFGPIVDVFVATNANGESRGHADVQFEDPDDAEAAVDNMEGAQVFGKTLRVRLSSGTVTSHDSKKPVWEQEEFLKQNPTS
jgi:peptidyl-prolyl isomerase E (cyclophilin E)